MKKILLSPLVIYLLVFSLSLAISAPQTSGKTDALKNAVVLVKAYQGNRERIEGAGIVIGLELNKVFILTAAHLVLEGADNWEVVFFQRKYDHFKAKPFDRFSDELDVAALIVELRSNDPLNESLTPVIKGNISQLKEFSDVLSIGHPLGNRWQTNPGNSVQRTSYEGSLQQFAIDKNALERGCSGGPVFDKQEKLIGMLTRIDALYGSVVKIDAIINQLKDWGIPTNLIENPSFPKGGGTLHVESTPPGAHIFLNKIDTGYKTPYTFREINFSDILEVMLFKDALHDTVRVTPQFGLEKTFRIHRNLEPKYGTISVSGSPTNAFVEISGENSNFKDQLPVSDVRVMPGNYLVVVSAPNHHIFSKKIQVEKGKNSHVTAKLQHHKGYLTVLSHPVGANVRIEYEEERLGVTPIYNKKLDTGIYSLIVSLDGYLDEKHEIKVREGRTIELSNIRLKTRKGSIQSKADAWRTRKWLAFVGAVTSGAAAVYFRIKADATYDSYSSATSTEDAINLRDETERNDLYFDIAKWSAATFFVSGIISWIVQNKYTSKANDYSMEIWKEKGIVKVSWTVQF